MPLVWHVHEDPGEALERVGGFGPRGRALGFVGAIGHGLGGAVIGQPFQRDGIPRAGAREPGGEGAIVLRDPKGTSHTAVCTWNPECG